LRGPEARRQTAQSFKHDSIVRIAPGVRCELGLDAARVWFRAAPRAKQSQHASFESDGLMLIYFTAHGGWSLSLTKKAGNMSGRRRV